MKMTGRKNEDSSEIGYLLQNYRDKKNGSIGLTKVKTRGGSKLFQNVVMKGFGILYIVTSLILEMT